METAVPIVIGVSTIVSVFFSYYLYEKNRQRLALLAEPDYREATYSFGIESFSGTTGGTNVTRLVALGLPGLANSFFAKTVADTPVVQIMSIEAGKWDYYRTDWKRVSKRKI